MSLSASKCSALLVIFCNVFFSWISGALLVLFGAVYLYDPSYLSMFTLLSVNSYPVYVFVIFSLSVIGLGGFIITLGLFGCFGTLCENQCILKTYVYLLILVFVIEVGLAGSCLFLYLAAPYVEIELKDNLVDEFRQFYHSSTHKDFNGALEFAQAHLHCCGINNYTDYDFSNWKSHVDNSSIKVPASCCSSKSLQGLIDGIHTASLGKDWEENEGTLTSTLSSLEEGDWMERCQSKNAMESDDYLYVQGCWSPLIKMYYQNTFFSFILFLSLAVLQIVGVTLSICLANRLKRKQRSSLKDLNVSEPLLL